MFWFQLVVVLLLLAAVGWLAVGGGGHMSEPVPDRADLALPDDRLVAARDLDQVRFSVGLRGYRMEEVDDVLDRLAREVEARDRRIAELEGRPDSSPYEDDGTGTGTDIEGGDGAADFANGTGPGFRSDSESAGESSEYGSDDEADYHTGSSAGSGAEDRAENLGGGRGSASADASPARSSAASAASPDSVAGEPGSGADLPPLP